MARPAASHANVTAAGDTFILTGPLDGESSLASIALTASTDTAQLVELGTALSSSPEANAAAWAAAIPLLQRSDTARDGNLSSRHFVGAGTPLVLRLPVQYNVAQGRLWAITRVGAATGLSVIYVDVRIEVEPQNPATILSGTPPPGLGVAPSVPAGGS